MPKAETTLQSLLQLLMLNSCSLTGCQPGCEDEKQPQKRPRNSTAPLAAGKDRGRPSPAGTDGQSCPIPAPPADCRDTAALSPLEFTCSCPWMPSNPTGAPGWGPRTSSGAGEVPRVCSGHPLLLWERSQGLSQPQAVLPALETPKTQSLADVCVPQRVKNSIIAHCFPCILGITDTRHRNLE